MQVQRNLTATLLFCLLLAVLSHQAHSQQNSDEKTACSAYLENINSILQQRQLKRLPLTFNRTIALSGRSFNDMGQVNECLDDSKMAFVRLTLQTSVSTYVYRGFCMDSVCDASTMDNDKVQVLIELSKIWLTVQEIISLSQDTNTMILTSLLSSFTRPPPPLLGPSAASTSDRNLENIIDPNEISFQQYAEFAESPADFAFITAVFSITACVFAAVSAPIVKYIITSHQRNKTSAASSVDEHYLSPLLRESSHQSTIIQLSNNHHNKTAVDDATLTSSLLTSTESPPRPPPPVHQRVLQCWNIVENALKLITLKSSNDDLLIFNGIRSLCFIQVVLGHEFYLHMNYMGNPSDLPYLQKKLYSIFTLSCLYSVDVFFWLGGFFLSYVIADVKMANQLSFKKPSKVLAAYVFAVVNRLFRIIPCYFLVLMFFWKISPYLAASPTWDVYTDTTVACDARWWQNLLLIDNFFPGLSEKCFGWGWYLSNDFQMFLVGMLLLIVYQNNRLAGKISIALTFAATQAVSIWLAYKWNFKVPCNVANIAAPNFYDGYYTKPWARSPPYFIGLFLGILYKEYQQGKQKKEGRQALSPPPQTFLKKIEMNMNASAGTKYAMYFTGFTLYAGLVFGPYDLSINGFDYWPDWFQNLWSGTCRSLYVISMSLIAIPAITGQKDLIIQFFSNKGFCFLQRLSFGGYLAHYIIIQYTIWSAKDAVYLSFENIMTLFFSEFIFTLIAATFIALLIEIPIMNLSAILLGANKPTTLLPTKPLLHLKQQSVNDFNITVVTTDKLSLLTTDHRSLLTTDQ